jgi:phospholipid-translocating ATPase
MATLDLQVNDIAKLLFVLVCVCALCMVAVPLVNDIASWGVESFTYGLAQRMLQTLIDFACFLLLFSQIIPISLRVALDVAKLVYKLQMMSDRRMPGLQVRSSTLPEELGGIEYLLTDKTGTLTRNNMKFRKLHLGFACLSDGSIAELRQTLQAVLFAHADATLAPNAPPTEAMASLAPPVGVGASRSFEEDEGGAGTGISGGVARRSSTGSLRQSGAASLESLRSRSPEAVSIAQALLAIALCHNVSPVSTDPHPETAGERLQDEQQLEVPGGNVEPAGGNGDGDGASANGDGDDGGDDDGDGDGTHFQGASPDELALVQFAARCGIVLVGRTPATMTLREPSGRLRSYEVLHEMPFSSETKRMGVLLRHQPSGQILFYVKGADTVMMDRVAGADWVEEETGNLAREGLRTLVVACRTLSEAQYETFAAELHKARLVKTSRNAAVRSAFEMLEEGMSVLCITAVEDQLQANVRTTLEMLRGANVRTWMLTGDKLETAKIVAQNSSLVARHQAFYALNVRSASEARQQLNGYPQGSVNAPCLILDGSSLELCVEHHTGLFIEVACAAPTVVVCRCSPTQKAAIVKLLRQHTNKCTAAIGDGGNDVGMIHAAHVGIGVEGREGRQAALAADFSIREFSHVARLVLWHGRNCYLRSATLSQFVIHRGLIISFIQLVFSSLFYFRPIPLYSGLLVLGYATIFTTGPVFSLVLDEDVSETNALKFPELYRELQKRRYLSVKTFLLWAWKALYQGGVIMLVGVLLFEQRFVHVVGITFTALILTENLMVVVEVKRWHPFMLLAQVLTLLVYVGAIIALSSPTMLDSTFDLQFILTVEFAWRVALLTAASTVPIWIGKVFTNMCAPKIATKLS